jgi:hypothetical protein
VLAATFDDTVVAVQDAVAALQKALTFGLQYGPMADVAVTALERWERSQPQVRDLHLYCYLSARTQLSMLRISSVSFFFPEKVLLCRTIFGQVRRYCGSWRHEYCRCWTLTSLRPQTWSRQRLLMQSKVRQPQALLPYTLCRCAAPSHWGAGYRTDMLEMHSASSRTDDDQEGEEAAGEEEVLEAQREAGKEARSILRGAAAAARRAQLRRQEVASNTSERTTQTTVHCQAHGPADTAWVCLALKHPDQAGRRFGPARYMCV